MAGKARRHAGGSVRRLPSGRWQARIRDRATNRLVSIGTWPAKADADAALAAAVTDSRRGGFVHPDRGRVTLRAYTTGWLADHPALSPRTRGLYRGLLDRHILPHLGNARIGDLQPATIRRWHADLAASTTPLQRAKAYRLLRGTLNTAVADGLLVANPCRIDGAGQERSPERPVATIPQVYALADAMPDHLRELVLVAAFASLRLGEAAGLRRRDVDPLRGRVHVRQQAQRLDDGTVVFVAPKTDSRRTVTLPRQVVDALAAHLTVVPADPDALVFTKPYGSPLDRHYVGRYWRAARTAVAGQDPTLPPGLRFHDLRGTGATLATANGATLREVMGRLGHRTTIAALQYQHVAEDRDATIARLLGAAIDGAGVDGPRQQTDR